MEVGARVWVRDPDAAWVTAVVEEVVNRAPAIAAAGAAPAKPARVSLRLRLDASGASTVVESAAEGGGSELTDVKLANTFEGGDGEAARVDDLIRLTMLHEPSILDVLCRRFEKSLIYTRTGPILLAVNPFANLPLLYSAEMLANYYSVGLLRGGKGEEMAALPPHVYGIADGAYRSMVEAMSLRAGVGEGGTPPMRNQSMLISGESGAGKTETTKIAMSYLATVGRAASAAAAAMAAVATSTPSKSGTKEGGKEEEEEEGEGAPTSVEARVLDSNPILEAFGNAKTLRNENSSRFGKFIELQFDRGKHLVGARIQTYLLEKVRLVSQGKGERNYHSFYQLLVGAKEKELKQWGMSGRGAADFAYTAASGCFALKGVDDAANYNATLKAMRTLGLKKDARRGVFAILAALLHLGNVAFESGPGQDGGERSSITASSAPALAEAARLLGLEGKVLTSILTQAKLDVRGDVTYRTFPPSIANDTRDALAKQVYGRLFEWLVARVNASIRADDQTRSFIGVLDIFGFESFDHNSFEQLCINFANETLQQHFNAYVFKIEQAEYAREAIAWNSVDFADNEDVLAMIAARKPAGLLPLLDETCMMPKGDDAMYARKVYEQMKVNPRFEAGAKHKAREQFIVRHYAGEVVYTAHGFCDKNRDTLHPEALEVMSGSSSAIVAACFAPSFGVGKDEDVPAYAREDGAAAPAPAAAPGNAMAAAAAATARLKATVGTQFTNQLRSLMAIIRGTKSHYIRCLKPNGASVPLRTDRVSMVAQLRCGGVLEAVRVSRMGYPVRLPHAAALARYRAAAASRVMRLKRAASAPARRATFASPRGAGALPLALSPAPSSVPLTFIDLSNVKLVMSDGGKMKAACADALRVLGGPRDQYQVGLTKVFFRKGCYDAVEGARTEEMGASTAYLQRWLRGVLARRSYLRLRKTVLLAQRLARGWAARRVLAKMRKQAAATRLQVKVRSFLTRSRYLTYRGAVVSLQSARRRVLATRRVSLLRADRAATRIAAAVKSSKARKAYIRQRAAAVTVQCAVRGWRARASLAALRRAAKDLNALKDEYKALKAGKGEMEEALKAAVAKAAQAQEALAQERAATAAAAAENAAAVSALAVAAAVAASAGDLQTTRSDLDFARSALDAMRSDLEASRSELERVRADIASLTVRLARSEADLTRERVEGARARDAWAQGADGEAALRALLADAEGDRASLRSLLHDAQGMVEGLRSEVEAATHGREAALEADRAATEAGEAAREAAEALTARAAEAEAEAAALREGTADMPALRAEVEAYKSECERLRVATEAARAEGEARLKSSAEVATNRLAAVQLEASKRLASAEAAVARALAEAAGAERGAAEAKAAQASERERAREAERALAGVATPKRKGVRAKAALSPPASASPPSVLKVGESLLPALPAAAAALAVAPARPASLSFVAEEGEEEEGEGEEERFPVAPVSEHAIVPSAEQPAAAPAVAPVTAAVPFPVPAAPLAVELLAAPSPPAAAPAASPPIVATPHVAADVATAPQQVPPAPAARAGAPATVSTSAAMASLPFPTPAPAPAPAPAAAPSAVPAAPTLPPSSANAAGTQLGWLFGRTAEGGRVREKVEQAAAPAPAPVVPAPAAPAPAPAVARRVSLAGAALASLLGGPSVAAKPAKPAVSERERAAAEMAAIVMSNPGLSASVDPLAGTEGGGAIRRQTSIAVPRSGPSAPMSSLSSSALSAGMILPVGGREVDVAAVARGMDDDPGSGMLGDILREMGARMVALKEEAEASTRAQKAAEERAKVAEKATEAAQAEVRRVGREADDTAAKMGALEQMAEMASGVKLALAQRLEAAMAEAEGLAEELEEAREEVKRARTAEGGVARVEVVHAAQAYAAAAEGAAGGQPVVEEGQTRDSEEKALDQHAAPQQPEESIDPFAF
jgi:myosin-5